MALQETGELLKTALSMKGLLRGKVAIITGASRGIGAASGRVFAEAGASVALGARVEGKVASLAKSIVAKGGRDRHTNDVSVPRGGEHLVMQIVQQFGRL